MNAPLPAPAANVYPREDAVMGIGMAILLTLVTCGLYGFYWQYRQMETLNALMGRREHDFLTWLLLSLVTCGIYAIYYEYRMSVDINELQESFGMRVREELGMLCVILTAFSVGIASLAIQQSEINLFYGERADF